jgi:hypothetical protein
MAAVAISDSNNRVEDFEGAGPTYANIGAGAAGGNDTTFFIQGVQAGSRKVVATDARGFWVSGFVAVNMSAAGDNRVLLFKGNLTDYVDVNSAGFNAFIASASAVNPTNSDSYEYLLHDDGSQGVGEFQYPILGGWIFEAIDPNVPEWIDVINGTIDLTAVDYFAISAGLANGAAKSTNIYFDSADLGDGLYLVGGDGGDADGVYQDWVTDDQGTQTAGRFGHVTTNGATIETGVKVLGKLVGGRTSAAAVTATVFTDSNKSLFWPGGRVDAGWNEHEWDLGSADTVIALTNCSYIGGGRDNRKIFFDTELQVTGGATDTIDVVAHGFVSGDAVLYSDEGGTVLGGLSDLTVYFVEKIDDDSFSLHALTSGRRVCFTVPAPISLTPAGAGAGENHSFRRQPDTRPDLTITSSSGSYAATGCTWQRNRSFTLTSGATITGGSMIGCSQVTLGGGTIGGLAISGTTTVEGEECFTGTVAQVENVSGCAFTASPTGGHAIEVTGAVSALDITGNKFTGYGPDPEDGDGHSFDTAADVVGGASDWIVYASHGWTTGDPAYYSRRDPTDGSLGTDNIGMADGDLVYVRSLTAGTFALYPTRYAAENDTNRIDLTGGTGETHTFYSGDAALVNNTGGDMTVNVTDGDTPSVRNIGASITTVQNTVTVTVTVKDENLAALQGARVLVHDDTVDPGDLGGIVRKETNASGVASESYNFGGAITVDIVVRKKGKVPVKQNQPLGAGGIDLTVIMAADGIVE